MLRVFPSMLLKGALVLWMSAFIASNGFALAGATMSGQASVHEVTGQAAVTAEVTPDRARRLALEDALYLAALQGGVAIDGFSAMDASTALSEETVLRPTAEILDYTIIEEKQMDNTSQVTIRAVTGL
ncbi:MAG: flagellar assembly protein T N-terminal domain-containing protein, partial [Pseudomonadota bacterium]|nr:flagellar assembly protein T N-terminal domain-containing protein [Pseudomonadota bacterium]